MLSFALRRAAAAAVTLLGVLSLVFAVLSAAPGDPARLAAGTPRRISPEALAAFRAAYGLDRPLPVRFGLWVAHAARLDFGRSLQDGRPVRLRIAETLPLTAAINAGALLIAAFVAVPLGVASARRAGGRLDRALSFAADVLFATPAFVAGLLLLLLFSVKLGWTPLFAAPEDGPRGIALPVVTLSLGSIALLLRFVRAGVLEALRAPADLAARARGEGERARLRRALRRAAVPFAALGAALVPAAISGSVLVERLFSLPGTGRLLADAVFARDLPTVLGLTLVVALAVVGASLAADLIAGALDPRTREEEWT